MRNRQKKVCPRCGNIYLHRGNLNSHLKKLKPCIAIYIDVDRNKIIDNYNIYLEQYLKKQNAIEQNTNYHIYHKPESITQEDTKKPLLKLKKLCKETINPQEPNDYQSVINEVFQEFIDNGDIDQEIINKFNTKLNDKFNRIR